MPEDPAAPPPGEALPATQPVIDLLVENHRRFLGFLEARVGSRELAEEILQQAFVRGVTQAHQLRHDESAVAWFYRLLRNAVIDRWRSRQGERRALERLAGMAPEAAVAPPPDDELFRAICGCVTMLLDTLRPEYADWLRKVDLDGGSIADLASAAGITPNSARVRLHRARQALKRQLEASCGSCTTHGCLECDCRPGGASA